MPMSKTKRKSKRKSKKTTQSVLVKEQPKLKKILWANQYCMLDTSSGASVSIRQILTQLKSVGWEVDIVGATIFDNKNGIEGLSNLWDKIKNTSEEVVNIIDQGLTYRTVKTKSTNNNELTMSEAQKILALYMARLEAFDPDIVMFYGGSLLNFQIALEARDRGIPTIAYLVNANYNGTRWCRDVDTIITDTQATSDYYTKNFQFTPIPLGKFIDPGKIISQKHERKNLVFINPSFAKGAGIVAQIAIILEKKRPDIQIEVVESRGNWPEVLQIVSKEFFKEERSELNNVIVTPNTRDITTIYSRCRVLLGLSVWWESGSRVLAEAMLNGIPSIVTNHGGSPEMVKDGGFVIDLPESCYKSPYNNLPNLNKINEIISIIENLYDDEMLYLHTVAKALQVGVKNHAINISTNKLETLVNGLIKDPSLKVNRDEMVMNRHKHKVDEEVSNYGKQTE